MLIGHTSLSTRDVSQVLLIHIFIKYINLVKQILSSLYRSEDGGSGN